MEKYINFDIFKNHAVDCIFTTKKGGVSKGHYATMNMSISRGDNKEDVMQNIDIVCADLGINRDQMVFTDQTHGSWVYVADKKSAGMGVTKPRNFTDTDALVTSSKDIALCGLYADCVPVFYYDPVAGNIAVSHGGWRGTLSNIVGNVVNALCDMGSSRENILACIGPSICDECYEVKSDVINRIPPKYQHFVIPRGDRKYLDLRSYNKYDLLNSGLKERNIEVSDHCTCCESDIFFSHRYHGKKRGTQMGLIRIRPQKN